MLALAALIACFTRLRDALARQLNLSFDPVAEATICRRLVGLNVLLALPA